MLLDNSRLRLGLYRMQKRLRLYLEVIADSLVGVKIAVTIIGIVSFGDVVKWIVQHWDAITRAIWNKIVGYFGLPEFLNAEQDALTTIALFLPLGLVAVVLRNKGKSAESHTKFTAGAFLVLVAFILFVDEYLQSCEEIPPSKWAQYFQTMTDNMYDTWIGDAANVLGPAMALSVMALFAISFTSFVLRMVWHLCRKHRSLSAKMEEIYTKVPRRVSVYLKRIMRSIFFVLLTVVAFGVLLLGIPLFIGTISAGGLQLAALLCAFLSLSLAVFWNSCREN